MKRYVAILMLLYAYGVCRAYQTIAPLKEEQFAEPPTAATFRAIEMPASNLLTGAVSFQVPLYTVSCHGLEIPVSLNYTSNGIKADDVAGPYGMGWVLTPDLRVTRKINGRPDDLFRYVALPQNYPVKPNEEPVITSAPTHEEDLKISDYYTYFMAMTEFEGVQPIGGENRYDYEYDLFTARLLDGSISFIMKNGVPLSLCADQYKITLNRKNGNGAIIGIEITDALGRIYNFSKEGAKQGRKEYTVEWLLQNITLPNGDIVSFDWEEIRIGATNLRATHTLSYGYIETDHYAESQGQTVGWNVGSGPNYNLRSIGFSGGSLQLNYNQSFDNYGKLVSAKVSNGTENVVTVNFQFDESDRFLKEVNHSQSGKYSFEYFPHSSNYSPDWWGYCKFSKNPGEYNVPYIKFKDLGPNHIPYSMPKSPTFLYDFNSNYSCVTAGILKKAVFPTGGIVEWEYEENYFGTTYEPEFAVAALSSDGRFSYGAGVRVSKIKLRNGENDTKPRERKYTYSTARYAALPFPHTFLDDKLHFGLYYGRNEPEPVGFALVRGNMEVQQTSHYMDYQDGKLPVWYEEVTETDAEGKTVYNFRDFIPDNVIKEQLGKRFPDSLYSIASQGPQMVERTVYGGDKIKGYEPILKEIFDFEVLSGTSYESCNVQRRLVQTQKTEFFLAPDFDNLKNFTVKITPEILMLGDRPPKLRPASLINIETIGDVVFRLDGMTPYECKRYTVLPRRERLRSKTTIEYSTTGNIERKETYGYVGNTPIVNDVVTKVGNYQSHLELEYPSAAPDLSTAMSIPSQMYRAHILAEPLSSKLTVDGYTQTAVKDMGIFNASMFLPKSISCGRGNSMITMATYDFDSKGNLRLITRPDGTRLAYIWGYNGLYPVYRIEGQDFSTLPASINGQSLTLDNTSFTTPLSKNLYKPLVGVISSTDAAGLTTSYSYDAAGRLAEISVDSLGTVAKYSYTINNGGVSRITSQKYLDSAGNNKYITTDVYDALGRPSMSIAHLPQGKVATLTDYDAMGRPYRKWSAAPCSDVTETPADIATAATEFYEDSAPYETTVYEPSPLSRPMKAIKPGSERHNADKGTNIVRCANNTSLAFSCPRYTASSNGVTYRGNYEAGTLNVEMTTDEDGLVVQTFTDFRGLKVAEKRGNSGQLATRYVYNGYGDLLYVLPPKLPDGSYSRSDDTFEQLAFWYDYDVRGNVVLKKIPGCHAVEYVYDPAGRLVGETDGTTLSVKDAPTAQPGSTLWTLHLYDALGREVISGQAYIPRATVTSLASVCRSVEWTGTGSLGGYTLSGGATAPALRSATVRIYDVAGRVVYEHTGEIERRNTYNRLGQTLQTTEIYAEGATLNHTYTYTYTGQTKTEKIESTLFDAPMMMRYDYDNADRLRDTWIDDGKGYVASSGMNYYYPYDSIGAFRNNYDRVGRVARINMGDRIERTFSYRPDGALATALTTVRKSLSLNYNFAPFRASTLGFDFVIDPENPQTAIVNPFDDINSSIPRAFAMGDSLFYKPSGRLSGRQVDGATMNYTYDGLGRLTFCEAGMVADPSADYSTSYTYDLNSNITSLRRAGAIDRVGSAIETGYHSEAEFELEGNRISWGTLWSVANTFEGATGILQDDAEVYHEYDAQGRLTASDTDRISEIEYNHLSQPVRVKFFDGKEQYSVYDNAGQLIKRYTRPGGGRADRIDQVFIGPYEFGANWSLNKIHFAGGYFTADGKVHYHITDYQGSVGAVICGDGMVEQRTHYYPYGEPWLEPEGDNRRLHTGKERLRWGTTPIHDFGARILPPAIPFWTTPDPCAEKYYHLGPYTFCAADPINHIDDDGCDIYKYDEEFRFIESIPHEKDVVMIGEEAIGGFELGTIERHFEVSIGEDTYDYLRIGNNEAAQEIFEFVTKNVEVSWVGYTIDDRGELNYISSSHEEAGEHSGPRLIVATFNKKGYVPNKYVHYHPSDGLWPSQGDINMLNTFETKYGIPVIKGEIYTKSKYKGLGNYVKYDKSTIPMSLTEFRKKYEVVK